MGNVCYAHNDVDVAESVWMRKRKLSDERDDTPVASVGHSCWASMKTPTSAPGVERESEFKITIDGSDGQRLGVDVNLKDGQTLLVEGVTGGLFQLWNDNNPHLEVKVGDRIVEAGGFRGDADEICQECLKCKLLEIVIRRA